MKGSIILKKGETIIAKSRSGVYAVPARKFVRGVFSKENSSKAYSTEELQAEYNVIGFGHGFCVVERREDGVKGSFEFSHQPRYYYNFAEADA